LWSRWRGEASAWRLPRSPFLFLLCFFSLGPTGLILPGRSNPAALRLPQSEDRFDGAFGPRRSNKATVVKRVRSRSELEAFNGRKNRSPARAAGAAKAPSADVLLSPIPKKPILLLCRGNGRAMGTSLCRFGNSQPLAAFERFRNRQAEAGLKDVNEKPFFPSWTGMTEQHFAQHQICQNWGIRHFVDSSVCGMVPAKMTLHRGRLQLANLVLGETRPRQVVGKLLPVPLREHPD